MIRINLLPIKKQRAAASGRNFLFVVLAVLGIEAVGIGILHASTSSELGAVQRTNEDVRGRIGRMKQEISDHDAIRTELDQIAKRDEIITKLKAARTGPVYVLMELGGILSPGRGPRVPAAELEECRRTNPLTCPNARWDVRRLWVTELTENDRAVKIKGQARDHADVAELLRRLTFSRYFEDEHLVRTQVMTNAELHMDLVEFEIICTARYQ